MKILKTYCIIVNAGVKSVPTSGAAVVAPTRASCKNVLYLLIVVGRTSAEGREKSQYRANVFGGGSEIQR
jgi:hypothetical protein